MPTLVESSKREVKKMVAQEVSSQQMTDVVESKSKDPSSQAVGTKTKTKKKKTAPKKK